MRCESLIERFPRSPAVLEVVIGSLCCAPSCGLVFTEAAEGHEALIPLL